MILYNLRGVTYALLKNHNHAIYDFTKIIQFNPDDSEAYFLCGLCYKEWGDIEKAQWYFAKARELGYNG